MSKPDIAFDHDTDSVKRREYGHGVTYIQNGVVFSSGFEPIRQLKESEFVASVSREQRVAKKKKKNKTTIIGNVRAEGESSLQKEGFAAPKKPDAVQQALQENREARKAEDYLE